ncbi:MAG TPA: acyl-CoA dehydrogenase family protein [Acetobacteraceae bacterium]|nr:acyl-CoA dehydrogenase family protein [Acetobacteraceae bacterium]
MDFDLTDEQRLLKDSVERLIADQYGFEQRKKYLREPNGWSAALWSQYAELGLLGLPFEESLGGFGGGAVETMIVMEAFGRGLILEPYFATVVLGGGLLNRLGDAAQRAELIAQIAQGKLKLAFAHVERHSRWNLADVATTAKKQGDGWVLEGSKGVVLHGDCADKLLVTARTAGGQRDRDGIGLFLVDASAAGVSRRGFATQDELRGAEVTLGGARAEAVLGDPGKALGEIERVVDQAIAALCAEAVGVMTVMHETTVEYLKTRQQFGRPIGSFQALQFRAVDMLTALEQARSMALFATVSAESDDPVERRRAIAAAKVQIGRSGKHIGQDAIQLHGGIGMTMEYSVGHYFKRMTMIDQMFGDADHHLQVLARLGGLFGPTRAAA